MNTSLFGFIFPKTEICTIDNIHYDISSHNGTCRLTSDDNSYVMIWSITNYPIETSGLPGSPYPVKINYSIMKKSNFMVDNALKSITGEFIYEINSGTLAHLSLLGIKYGIYHSCASNNKSGTETKILFNLLENKPLQLYMFN